MSLSFHLSIYLFILCNVNGTGCFFFFLFFSFFFLSSNFISKISLYFRRSAPRHTHTHTYIYIYIYIYICVCVCVCVCVCERERERERERESLRTFLYLSILCKILHKILNPKFTVLRKVV